MGEENMSKSPAEVPTSMRHTKRRVAATIVCIAVVIAAAFAVKYGRYHFLPRRFDVVEDGRIYRGGQQEARPYERLLGQHRIKTIVTLLDDDPDDPAEIIERQEIARHDLHLLRFPMPGDGRAPFDTLEAAADAIADPANQPVFVHCAAGVQRTGAAIAVYRLRHCGWTLEQALAEAADHRITPARTPELVAHLTRYFRERVRGQQEAPR